MYYFGKKNEITEPEQTLLKRIGFRSKIELVPLPQAGITQGDKAKKLEAENLLSKISDQSFVIAFDERGQSKDSIAFSKWLKDRLIDQDEVVFVIGGAYGLDESLLNRANEKLCLGRMVWTRNLCRYMALEQIYRALEIDGGSHFHK